MEENGFMTTSSLWPPWMGEKPIRRDGPPTGGPGKPFRILRRMGPLGLAVEAFPSFPFTLLKTHSGRSFVL